MIIDWFFRESFYSRCTKCHGSRKALWNFWMTKGKWHRPFEIWGKSVWRTRQSSPKWAWLEDTPCQTVIKILHDRREIDEITALPYLRTRNYVLFRIQLVILYAYSWHSERVKKARNFVYVGSRVIFAIKSRIVRPIPRSPHTVTSMKNNVSFGIIDAWQ